MTKSIRRQNNSLAGWLFADLSIVLALVFMSSQMRSTPAEMSNESSITTTTTNPNSASSGVSVEPITVIFELSSNLNPAQVQAKLEDALAKKGVPSGMKFGVVLILAGATDDSSEAQLVAQQKSEQIEQALLAWDRLTLNRWVNGSGFDKSLKDPIMKVRLLQDLTNP